jgi:hypothetical protein
MLASTFFLSSCEEKGTDDPEPLLPVIELGKIMIVHASPDAPDVDILLDDVKKNGSPVVYLDNSDYLPALVGQRNLKINIAGTTTSALNQNIAVAKDASYTVFAAGFASNLIPIVVKDSLVTPATGKAHIRFIHLSPDAPAVDIKESGSGGAVLFSNRAYRSVSNFISIDAGEYTLDAMVAGSSVVAITVTGITFEAGKIYTVYARGSLGGSGNSALGASIIVNN